MRTATVERITKETQIRGKLKIEGKRQVSGSRPGIRFFDHMLELFAKHGGFDLELTATGDLDVDQHHTVEDVGIALGQLFAQALGDRKGINRAGYFVMPMDETLSVVAVDLGGRPALVYADLVKVRLVGDLQTELVHDFLTVLPCTPGPMCTVRYCTGAATITSSKVSSSALRGR
jgi:imidazoleglycerol-phosphate dehydratase